MNKPRATNPSNRRRLTHRRKQRISLDVLHNAGVGEALELRDDAGSITELRRRARESKHDGWVSRECRVHPLEMRS